MANEKKSPEEIFNEKKLVVNYEKTGYCPKCHIKLPLNNKCHCQD